MLNFLKYRVWLDGIIPTRGTPHPDGKRYDDDATVNMEDSFGDVGVDLAAGTSIGPGPLSLRPQPPRPCQTELAGKDRYWEGGEPCCKSDDGDFDGDFNDVNVEAATQLAMADPITGTGLWPIASSPNPDVGNVSDGGPDIPDMPGVPDTPPDIPILPFLS